MREYQRLARNMVALQPDSMKYRMEVQYADTDLGVVLFDQRRFAEAVAQFDEALGTMEAISTADPGNQSYRKSVAESLAWLADAQRAAGRLAGAIAARNRGISLLERLRGGMTDVDVRLRLVAAHTALGTLYDETGQRDAAVQQFHAAIALADELKAIEPNNARWLEIGFAARKALAESLLQSASPRDAAAPVDEACATVEGLVQRKVPIAWGSGGMRECWLMRTRIALAQGQSATALQAAQRAVSSAQAVHSSDRLDDRYALAAALLLLGDAERSGGQAEGAGDALNRALSTLPSATADNPSEIVLRSRILSRVGKTGEAAQLPTRLRALGYAAH